MEEQQERLLIFIKGIVEAFHEHGFPRSVALFAVTEALRELFAVIWQIEPESDEGETLKTFSFGMVKATMRQYYDEKDKAGNK